MSSSLDQVPVSADAVLTTTRERPKICFIHESLLAVLMSCHPPVSFPDSHEEGQLFDQRCVKILLKCQDKHITNGQRPRRYNGREFQPTCVYF